jgi:Bacterial SCP ortholog
MITGLWVHHLVMPSRRRTDPAAGRAAVARWAADPGGAGRDVLATAVRWSLEELAARYPGPTCEVRVPPFGVVQCLAGPRHTRGTPPNAVETDAATWLGLVVGTVDWADARARGAVSASGERADLAGVFPLCE